MIFLYCTEPNTVGARCAVRFTRAIVTWEITGGQHTDCPSDRTCLASTWISAPSNYTRVRTFFHGAKYCQYHIIFFCVIWIIFPGNTSSSSASSDSVYVCEVCKIDYKSYTRLKYHRKHTHKLPPRQVRTKLLVFKLLLCFSWRKNTFVFQGRCDCWNCCLQRTFQQSHFSWLMEISLQYVSKPIFDRTIW